MSKNGGSHDPRKPWAQNHKIIKNIKIMNIFFFFHHGKDAHRYFEKGALNESSRSFIWSVWEQKVFLEICEKVSKVSNLDLFVPRPQNTFFGHLKVQKVVFFGQCAQRSNVGVSFLFFFQNMLYVTFGGRVSFACFS